MTSMQFILILHASATLYMAGLIWFVQIVHYPLLREVGAERFVDYERRHVRLTTWVVTPAMALELGTALWLLYALWGTSLQNVALIGATLLLIIWLSTMMYQAPSHRSLSRSFDSLVWRRLVRSNWIRTIAWSARSILSITILAGALVESRAV